MEGDLSGAILFPTTIRTRAASSSRWFVPTNAPLLRLACWVATTVVPAAVFGNYILCHSRHRNQTHSDGGFRSTQARALGLAKLSHRPTYGSGAELICSTGRVIHPRPTQPTIHNGNEPAPLLGYLHQVFSGLPATWARRLLVGVSSKFWHVSDQRRTNQCRYHLRLYNGA